MLPEDIKKLILPVTGEIIRVSTCSGGSINLALKIEAENGFFFLKYNTNPPGNDMFETEARGLDLLSRTDGPFIPKVNQFGVSHGIIFILMDFIENGPKTKTFWENFGRQLANLHLKHAAYFGEENDNYIGSLKQKNTKHKSWSEFFKNERLLPQWKLARDRGYFNSAIDAQFNGFLNRLSEFFPEEQSSLLHGDLWSGNFVSGKNNKPWLIDPAMYYGHREMDLAMSKLFGGFDPLFYSAYQEVYQLENEWESRIDLCNLYPLLVHVNLFGGAYAFDVQTILSRI